MIILESVHLRGSVPRGLKLAAIRGAEPNHTVQELLTSHNTSTARETKKTEPRLVEK